MTMVGKELCSQPLTEGLLPAENPLGASREDGGTILDLQMLCPWEKSYDVFRGNCSIQGS